MSPTYPTIQHQWFDQVWNQGQESAIDELLCPDVIGHGLVDAEGNEIVGIEGFRAFFHGFRQAFPDIHVEVTDTISEGDKVVANCRVTATHSGDGFLMPATGKPVEFTGVCIVRVSDGKIAESWNSFDFLTLMQQLEAIEFRQ